jgi:hypothetical protein
MKTRILIAVIALVALCQVAMLTWEVSRPDNRLRVGRPQRAWTSAASGTRMRYLRQAWLADARTAVAAVQYLLKPEPREADTTLAASNGEEDRRPGLASVCFQYFRLLEPVFVHAWTVVR